MCVCERERERDREREEMIIKIKDEFFEWLEERGFHEMCTSAMLRAFQNL